MQFELHNRHDASAISVEMRAIIIKIPSFNYEWVSTSGLVAVTGLN